MKSFSYYAGDDIEQKCFRPRRPKIPWNSKEIAESDIRETYTKLLEVYNDSLSAYREEQKRIEKIKGKRRVEFHDDLYVEFNEYSVAQVDAVFTYVMRENDSGISQDTVDTMVEIFELHDELNDLGL